MAGKTGYTPTPDNFDPAPQIDAAMAHFDDVITKSVPDDEDLPSTGNWPGRSIWVESRKAARQWDGSEWTDAVGVFTFNPTYKNHASWKDMELTRRGKRARLRGVATIVGNTTFSANTSYTLGTVPNGWRPAEGEQVIVAAAQSPFGGGIAWIAINANGTLTFAISQNTTQNANAWLLGIDIEWDLP